MRKSFDLSIIESFFICFFRTTSTAFVTSIFEFPGFVWSLTFVNGSGSNGLCGLKPFPSRILNENKIRVH